VSDRPFENVLADAEKPGDHARNVPSTAGTGMPNAMLANRAGRVCAQARRAKRASNVEGTVFVLL